MNLNPGPYLPLPLSEAQSTHTASCDISACPNVFLPLRPSPSHPRHQATTKRAVYTQSSDRWPRHLLDEAISASISFLMGGDSASPRRALRWTRYHEWLVLGLRNAMVGVGSKRGCEEFKGGNCGSNEEGGVVIEDLADLSSSGVANLYV
ncbi:hypothetical protein K443DRAFT_686411 [Laccaria amethystina LaAM-08-1]|uniref:Uncharacterized protein n=1 Tax=Laccaria amethystina LaAM-08-1 TaxID=1095629 RepID=A0A0C9WM70_9AGAR|nr:hypothetical protein K443DRAFT_686411 [Laccaria amethystina LaAM-08-1]